MSLRGFAGLLLFLGSYLPLSVILLVQDFQYAMLKAPLCLPSSDGSCSIPLNNPGLSIGVLVLCSLSLAATAFLLKSVTMKREISVMESKHIPADLMNYSLPYVVSFMSLDYGQTGKLAGFAIFMLWMYWLSLKSGQVLVNPVLMALSWRLYEIRYAHAGDTTVHTGRALSNGPLPPEKYDHAHVDDLIIVRS